MPYPFSEIEERWQRYWRDNRTFATDVRDTSRPKYYVLDMFPYPSGDGLHVGHPEGYTATDIVARYKRHMGFNVLHPMGWDAFGLPTERYAMQTNVHPTVTTQRNVANFRRQLSALGFSFDWDREVNTTDPAYYRWTQWIFLKLYGAWYDTRIAKARPIDDLVAELGATGCSRLDKPSGWMQDGIAWGFDADEWNAMSAIDRQRVLSCFRLAYEAESPVNWCEELGTVLANEEVEEWAGKGYTVERRPMKQWMMRITAYSDRLLAGLDGVQWPGSTMLMQRNWIGKSYGAEILFRTESGHELKVFTTRPDTLYGVTFMTIAPEHPAIAELTTDAQRGEVERYTSATAMKSERDRQSTEEKTGVWTGSYAIHPATGDRVPIWTSDYVLAGYGTGAVMGVPAHDERDFAFARSFGIAVRPVIVPADDEALREQVRAGAVCYTGDGLMINSQGFDGMESVEAKQKIVEHLGAGVARTTVQFKQRDWLFSRQRYWGEPIPIVKYENGLTFPLDESELPLMLPDLAEFKPSGSTESPLALATDWLNVEHPVHGRGRRETNTMPQWAGSCWYYLRYVDPGNTELPIDPDLERHWLPVDLYIGGQEHAVLHLLYARFWHNVLRDLGYVSSAEPFVRLIHQGMILGEDSQKMSKSRGNVINPDAVIAEFGADSVRLFEMFMGPLEMTKPWSTAGVEGVRRFLNRSWRMIVGDEEAGIVSAVVEREPTPQEDRVLHATIAKVTEDIEALRLNTAISALMMFVNEFINVPEKPRAAMEAFAILLSPFAPHIAEEFWSRLGHDRSISVAPWPVFDASKVVEDEVEIVVQVNSKIKTKMRLPAGTEVDALERAALDNEIVRDLIGGMSVRKVIAVKDRLVNVIAG